MLQILKIICVFQDTIKKLRFRLNDASKTTGGQAPPANVGQLNGNVPSVFDALTLLVTEFKMIIHRFIQAVGCINRP